MKKFVCALFAAVLMMGACFIPCASAAVKPPTVQPQYIGVTKILAILEFPSNNLADCTARVTLSPGYTADGLMALQQLSEKRWETIKSWDISGTGSNA